jgi:hypothetical protein
MTELQVATSIKVKSPRMLAELISWTQGDFYPDPKQGFAPTAAADRRPTAETMDTVNFQKIDEDNDWTDI